MAFVLFQAGALKLEFEPKSEAEAALALHKVALAAQELAWRLAPIKHEAIASLAPSTLSTNELLNHLRSLKLRDLEAELLKACKEVKIIRHHQEIVIRPIKFAWAYYLRCLLRGLSPAAMVQIKQQQIAQIKFAADVAGYRAVRKTSSACSDAEALACLAAVSASALRKAAELALPAELRILKPQRRSLKAIADALESLKIDVGEEFQELARSYVIQAICEACGYPCSITPAMVYELWPQFKMPGAPGRKAK